MISISEDASAIVFTHASPPRDLSLTSSLQLALTLAPWQAAASPPARWTQHPASWSSWSPVSSLPPCTPRLIACCSRPWGHPHPEPLASGLPRPFRRAAELPQRGRRGDSPRARALPALRARGVDRWRPSAATLPHSPLPLAQHRGRVLDVGGARRAADRGRGGAAGPRGVATHGAVRCRPDDARGARA